MESDYLFPGTQNLMDKVGKENGGKGNNYPVFIDGEQRD